MSPLPAGARRLFPHYREEDLTPDLLVARLLEDGGGDDLAWLVGVYGEERLAAWLVERGGRQLSARSRAFWQIVLGREAARPLACDLWPL